MLLEEDNLLFDSSERVRVLGCLFQWLIVVGVLEDFGPQNLVELGLGAAQRVVATLGN